MLLCWLDTEILGYWDTGIREYGGYRNTGDIGIATGIREYRGYRNTEDTGYRGYMGCWDTGIHSGVAMIFENGGLKLSIKK